jgi:prolyl-tRNA synthetase
MLQSKLFAKTKKESPKGEKSINAILLQRAGFVHKEMAGVYTFLPLGLRVLRKIEKIIREEIERISGQEVLMSVLQPKSLWLQTNRWSQGIGKEVMYKCQGDGEVGLGPTHEEMITDIVRNFVYSFEDLPLYIYQIQTKFRKEPRARSGLLRGREFLMKDLYSFHASEEDFKNYYQKVKKAYFRIFKRCGLKTILTEASGAGFTEGFTHEFQVLAEGGEDTIIYCPTFHFSQNKEIAKFKAGQKCPVCKKTLRAGKSIEVGNIFPLGTKYSKALGAFFQDKEGRRKPIVMGCYGIGVSRAMGAIVEVHHDEKGIIWPKSVSPFNVHLLSLGSGKKSIDRKIKNTCQKLYNDLQNKGFEVLYDDREEKTPGEKFADADLIGIPYRIVVSERTLRKNSVEIKKRSEKKVQLLKIRSLLQFLNSKFKSQNAK